MAAEAPSPEAWAELAEGVLDHVEEALEAAAPEDVTFERTGDALTVEFDSGVKYVLSINREALRLYVSAEGHGDTFTYQPDDGDWCAEDGRELYAWLAGSFGERTGVSLDL